MSATITWTINELERQLSDGYVYRVHYGVLAKDETYRASAVGTVDLERPESDLIAFSDLSAELVLSWVQEKLGTEKVEEIQTALQQHVDEQRTPSVGKGMPWQ
jgi:hypothetical protein